MWVVYDVAGPHFEAFHQSAHYHGSTYAQPNLEAQAFYNLLRQAD